VLQLEATHSGHSDIEDEAAGVFGAVVVEELLGGREGADINCNGA